MIDFISCVLVDRKHWQGDLTGPYPWKALIEPTIVEPMPGLHEASFVLDLIVILTLWGGGPGEHYSLSVTFVYPDGDGREPEPMHTYADLVWPADIITKTTIPAQINVLHRTSGTYYLRFLLNGQPLTEARIPIVWIDDIPEDQQDRLDPDDSA